MGKKKNRGDTAASYASSKPSQPSSTPTDISGLKSHPAIGYRILVVLHDMMNIAKDPTAAKRTDRSNDELYLGEPYFSPSESAIIKAATTKRMKSLNSYDKGRRRWPHQIMPRRTPPPSRRPSTNSCKTPCGSARPAVMRAPVARKTFFLVTRRYSTSTQRSYGTTNFFRGLEGLAWEKCLLCRKDVEKSFPERQHSRLPGELGVKWVKEEKEATPPVVKPGILSLRVKSCFGSKEHEGNHR